MQATALHGYPGDAQYANSALKPRLNFTVTPTFATKGTAPKHGKPLTLRYGSDGTQTEFAGILFKACVTNRIM